MSPATVQLHDTFVQCQCYSCGVWYFVPATLYVVARRRGPEHSLYCPNGHGTIFTVANPDYEFKRDATPIITIVSNPSWADMPMEPPAPLPPPLVPPKPDPKLTPDRRKKQCPHCGRRVKGLAGHLKRMHPGVMA